MTGCMRMLAVIVLISCVQVLAQETPCPGPMQCRDQQDCQDFLQQKERLGVLDRQSDQYRDTLRQLRNRICDKRSKTVCCEPGEGKCPEGRECRAVSECPLFQLEKAQLTFIERESQKYQEKLGEIKSLVCNKNMKKVCCFRPFI